MYRMHDRKVYLFDASSGYNKYQEIIVIVICKLNLRQLNKYHWFYEKIKYKIQKGK